MEEKKEVEICRRTFESDHRKAKIWRLISLIWILVSLLANIIVALAIGGYVGYMFTYPGPFWAGYGNMILGFIGFVVFWLISLSRDRMEIVLTDRRLLVIRSKKRLFTGVISHEKSYLLNRIVSFELLHYEKKGLYYLAIRNASENSASLLVDKEFYDKFVKLF